MPTVHVLLQTNDFLSLVNLRAKENIVVEKYYFVDTTLIERSFVKGLNTRRVCFFVPNNQFLQSIRVLDANKSGAKVREINRNYFEIF